MTSGGIAAKLRQKQAGDGGFGSSASVRSITTEPGSGRQLDINFLGDVDEGLLCVVCKNVLRNPMIIKDCGHKACSTCITPLMKSKGAKCPVDDKPFKKQDVETDKETQKILSALPVKCSYERNGCGWSGVLGELGSHLEGCDNKPVICPNNCGLEFEQRFLSGHLSDDCPKREIECKFCSENLLASDEPSHMEQCQKFPVPCPNKCSSEEIPREELQDHLMTKCKKQLLPCPFARHGCKARCKQNAIKDHVESSQLDHLTGVNSSLVELLKIVEVQTASVVQCESQSLKMDKKMQSVERFFGAAFIWRLDNWSEKIAHAKSGKRATLFSAPFYSHRYGYRLSLSLHPNGEGAGKGKYMSVFVCLCKGDYDPLLEWPFNCAITLSIVDQSADSNTRKHIEHVVKPHPCNENKAFLGRPRSDKNPAFGVPKFCEIAEITKDRFAVEDILYIKVHVNTDDLVLL